MNTDDQPAVLFHLHLSDATPVEEEEITLADGKTAKVLWKDVLVEGEYPMSPGPAGATSVPMKVVAEGESDAATKTIAMSDLLHAHEDGAFKYVTVPTTHRDGVLDNTGYVPRPEGLRVVEKRGKKVMQAALGFTEPDVKGKVARGTIPDVSAGIFFNWLNKHTKKSYRAAMKHVALTPVPFMGNLDPFPAVFASDEEIADDTQVEVYNLADGEESGDNSGDKSTDKAEIVWNEAASFNFVRNQLSTALNPEQPAAEDGRPVMPRPSYHVQDVSTDDTALVEEYFKGEVTRFVIPFERGDDGIKIAPVTRWVEVREAMIAASDKNFEEMASATLREKLGVELSDQIGTTDSVYRIEDVSLDNRVRITSRAKGKSWIANFAVLDNGSVWLAPADQWESIEASDTPKDDSQRPEPSTPKSNVISLDDGTMEARLRVARQRRRQLLAGSSSKSQ